VALPLVAVVTVAAAKLVLHLVTNGQYGYQRDELYYLASGNHPSAGYVDYPPITPLLARLDSTLLGDSPWALRLLPTVVGVSLVLLTALVARELGGGRNAQVLAAIATASNGFMLGSNWLFQTVTFDELWWTAAIWLFARMLRTRDVRLWLAIGALIGLGLETKLTIAGLGVGLAAGVVLTPLRSQLRTAWPWLGVCLAALLVAPNIVWQQLNGWPSAGFVSTHASVIQAAGQGLSLNFDSGGPLAFLELQPLLIGPVTLPIWLMGWYFLFRTPRARPLAVASLVTFGLFLIVGKAYYPAPLIAVLLAAGCVQLETTARRRNWAHATPIAAAAMVLQMVVSLPISVPLVPQSSLAGFGLDQFRKDYADTVGWPQLVQQIARAYAQLSPEERQSSVILAGNYGEAGAIDLYGPALGLPQALSPHLTFWYWKPPHVVADSAVAIGIDPTTAHRLFADVSQVGIVESVDGVHSEEVGRPILVCRRPLVPLDAAWPSLRNFK
jgi:4-amino-4-deoxy-L-arabinose transferase-like glycosyltransferase